MAACARSIVAILRAVAHPLIRRAASVLTQHSRAGIPRNPDHSAEPPSPFTHMSARTSWLTYLVLLCCVALQAQPLIAGLSVAAAALSARYAITAFQAFKAAPPTLRRFYEGGFLPEMTRREASLILGVRESANADRIKAAHKRIMVANHPDAGGSSYMAAKINEAKDILTGKKSPGGSAF